MTIFRLTRQKYAHELSGYGASLFGNRWNSKGIKMIYAAESRALAMAEVVVHITLANLPSDFMMVEIDVPDSLSIGVIERTKLAENWNAHPFQYFTQQMGDEFIRNQEHAILKVPSAVVKGDYNYLINPIHPEFKNIYIKNASHFPFDHRIFNEN